MGSAQQQECVYPAISHARGTWITAASKLVADPLVLAHIQFLKPRREDRLGDRQCVAGTTQRKLTRAFSAAAHCYSRSAK